MQVGLNTEASKYTQMYKHSSKADMARYDLNQNETLLYFAGDNKITVKDKTYPPPLYKNMFGAPNCDEPSTFSGPPYLNATGLFGPDGLQAKVKLETPDNLYRNAFLVIFIGVGSGVIVGMFVGSLIRRAIIGKQKI